jgi:hypothetical protein
MSATARIAATAWMQATVDASNSSNAYNKQQQG